MLFRSLDEAAAHIRVQARAAAWMDLLAEGLIAGVVSSLVLTHAVASRKIGALLFAMILPMTEMMKTIGSQR